MNHWQISNNIVLSNSNFDTLADLLESIAHFAGRLKIYTRIPPTPELDAIVVRIIVELISTLALVTKKLTQRRQRELVSSLLTCYLTQCDAVKWVSNFFAAKDITEARQRLDKLRQEDILYLDNFTFGPIDSLEKNITKGERMHSAFLSIFFKKQKKTHSAYDLISCLTERRATWISRNFCLYITLA